MGIVEIRVWVDVLKDTPLLVIHVIRIENQLIKIWVVK
jgi:hypothetical protein